MVLRLHKAGPMSANHRFVCLPLLLASACLGAEESAVSAFVVDDTTLVLQIDQRPVPVRINGWTDVAAPGDRKTTAELVVSPLDGDAFVLVSNSYQIFPAGFTEPLLLSGPSATLGFVIQTAPIQNGLVNWSEATLFVSEDEQTILWTDVRIEPGLALTVRALDNATTPLWENATFYSGEQRRERPHRDALLPDRALRIVALPRGVDFWGCLWRECTLAGPQKKTTYEPRFTVDGFLP